MSVEGLVADDHRLAAGLAHRAGRMLVELRARLTREEAPAAVVGAEGDRRAHELLVAALAAARPADAVLSEEGVDDASRLTAERVWVIDPLDGTRQFSETAGTESARPTPRPAAAPDGAREPSGAGRADWAVHVALVVAERPVAGAVALPALGLTLSTADPPRLLPPRAGPPRLVVSRTRPPAQADAVAAALGADVVPMGSAGAKSMAVVRGAADVYVHAGGQHEWDSCAPAAVAKAAGCFTGRLDGSRLRYNQPDVRLPDLVVCRPELAGPVLAALSAG